MVRRPGISRLRVWIVLGASTAVLFLAPIVMAQDTMPPSASQARGDMFPAGLGYAAIGIATAVWGTMATVVGKLWSGRETERAAHLAQIKGIEEKNQLQIDALKNECRQEIAKVRDRLEVELKERREEAERLLREQKDIMREVMTTCVAMNGALKTNSEAIDRLREALTEESGS